MDIATILGLIAKGVSVIQTIAAVGRDVAPAVTIVKSLIASAHQPETVTQTDLDATEAALDALIDDFNEPM